MQIKKNAIISIIEFLTTDKFYGVGYIVFKMDTHILPLSDFEYHNGIKLINWWRQSGQKILFYLHKYLIINLLPIKKVPIFPMLGLVNFGRYVRGGVMG